MEILTAYHTEFCSLAALGFLTVWVLTDPWVDWERRDRQTWAGVLARLLAGAGAFAVLLLPIWHSMTP